LRIISFTGSRSEYYLLRPLFVELQERKKYELFLIVSGGILQEKNKQTLRDIRKDQITICGEINLEEIQIKHSYSIGKISIEAADLIEKINPDLSIVYADRYESFGFAIAASHSNIPILHLEAGDITEGGTYDDQIRHCISKLSHLFCTSTLKGSQTLYRLGEEKWRCIQSGLLSYEDMNNISNEDREAILNEFKIEKDICLVLATMHPIPRDLELTKIEILEFLEGLKLFSQFNNSKIIITAPNNDQGNEIITCAIRQYLPEIKDSIFIESLGGYKYHTIMSLAKLRNIIICGNSSSVIKEAPFYGAHSLNIGKRQTGRESSSNQKDCPAERKLISRNLYELSKTNCSIGKNPYFKENPSKRIIEFIEEIFTKKTLKEILFKKWAK